MLHSNLDSLKAYERTGNSHAHFLDGKVETHRSSFLNEANLGAGEKSKHETSSSSPEPTSKLAALIHACNLSTVGTETGKSLGLCDRLA